MPTVLTHKDTLSFNQDSRDRRSPTQACALLRSSVDVGPLLGGAAHLAIIARGGERETERARGRDRERDRETEIETARARERVKERARARERERERE